MKGSIALFVLYILMIHPVSSQSLRDSAENINVSEKDSININHRRIRSAIITIGSVYVAEISYLRFIWYKDHERVPFQFYKDGKGWQQIDKFGHAFGSYIASYIGYNWLRSAGVPKNKALLYGGTLGILLQTPIEVLDGPYEGYGFSWGDMMANAAGSALLIGQELLFNEQMFKYKFSYSRSVYADRSNGFLGTNTLNSLWYDYNGHSYWLSANANKFFLKEKLPRWLNIAIGYSANGMFGEFSNLKSYRGQPIPETKRYRQYLLSVDVDWSKIRTRSKVLKTVFKGLEFIKIPAPALEFNSTGKLKGYALYF